jgi:hypothetical protein
MNMRSFFSKFGMLAGVAFVCLLNSCCCQKPTIYWSKFDPCTTDPHHAIMRAKLDELPLIAEEVLKTVHPNGDPRIPGGLAVDEKKQRIYWADPDTRRIKTASLVDKKAENFPADCYVQYPSRVALDQSGHRLFWTAQGVNDGGKVEGSIEYAYTDERDKCIHVLFRDKSIIGASGIALDTRMGQRRVYWLRTTGELQSIDMDGKEKTPVDHGKVPAQQAYDLAFVPSLQKIFWVNTGHGSIGYARFENGKIIDPKYFMVSNSQPSSLFADLRAMRLYWGYSDPGTAITFIEWISLKEPLSSQPKSAHLPFKTRAAGIHVGYSR